MLVRNYDLLPAFMKNEIVRSYYEMLDEKRSALVCKRLFDIFFSVLLLIVLSPVIITVALMIRIDSKGPVFYRQERITANLKVFRIVKFRTMYNRESGKDSPLTVAGDGRITSVGKKLRKLRLDEIPQLFNILVGSMSFVGTRPEVPKYVMKYTDSMKATLLLPAGLTSEASIRFSNESELLGSGADTERIYLEEILPSKMTSNLEYLRDYRFINDIKILFGTLFRQDD